MAEDHPPVAPAPDDIHQDFHRLVLDGLPEAVIVAAPDGTVTFVNAATQVLLGYSADEIVGRPITVLVPVQPGRRADPVKWLHRWADEPDSEQSRFLDLTARRRDGHEMPVEVRVRAGEIGGARRFFVTVRDNTVRRREQAQLKDANLRSARILLLAEDAIVSVDSAQRIIFFNLAAERMFGFTAEEAVGQKLSLLLPPEARSVHDAHMENFRLSRQASRMMSDRRPVAGLRRSGERFPVEATITKVMTAGELTYTANVRDVSERDKIRADLLEKEQRIRAVFDNASIALALLNRDGLVLEINRAAAALASPGGSLIGLPLWSAPWLGVDPAANPAAAEPLRTAIVQAGAGRPARIAFELPREGRSLPIEVRLTPITGDGGKIVYVLAEGHYEADTSAQVPVRE